MTSRGLSPIDGAGSASALNGEIGLHRTGVDRNRHMTETERVDSLERLGQRRPRGRVGFAPGEVLSM
jgi:hypothetical protein